MRPSTLLGTLGALSTTLLANVALADIPPGGGPGGCSMASGATQGMLAGAMVMVGCAALLISRRRGNK